MISGITKIVQDRGALE